MPPDTESTAETVPPMDTETPAQPTEDMAEEKQPESTAKVQFDVPKGFIIPEGAAQNDGEFDSVATFKVEGEKLCLVKVGDKAMPGYDKGSAEGGEQKPPPPSFNKMIGGIMADNPAGQQQQ